MEDFQKVERETTAHTYKRQPLLLIEGKGIMVKDSEGRSYIDCFSGIAVNNVGHIHPKVVQAIKKQSSKLIHTSNIYYTVPQLELAKKLKKISGGYQSFFCNSGAEANEAAIKLARKHTGKIGIIAAENSFHGRTFATLSATGQEKYKKDFRPLLPGFSHVPFGKTGKIKKAITSDTAAVLLEPIQGEGGVIVPPSNYLKEVSEICKEKSVLLILDEVQTGMGRTGRIFGWQTFGVEPDIFTLAKALGGGMPIGAMLARKEVMVSFEPGDHASTFGGNPVTSSAALANTEVILKKQLAKNAHKMGELFQMELLKLKEKYRIIKDVRGIGLLIGVELEKGCPEIVDRARNKGLLINCIQGNILRIAPPLIITRDDVMKIIRILDAVINEAGK